MFDLGSFELILVLVVALMVMGPKQLPVVARRMGLWVRYGKNLLRGVQHDLERFEPKDKQE